MGDGAVLDYVLLSFALQVRDERGAHPGQVVRVDVRQRLVVGALVVAGEHHFQAGMQHLGMRQVPVPQAEFAGVEGQVQARLALAQLVGHLGQFTGALGDTLFEFIVGLAQLAFGVAALLDFAGKLGVELFGALRGTAQALDEDQLLQALLQAVTDQAADLPGGQAERGEDDDGQHAPAALQHFVAEQQEQPGRQQAGHGEAEEGRQADAIGDAGGPHHRADQPVQRGLLEKGLAGHQGADGVGQADGRNRTAEQEAPVPAGLALPVGACLVEGRGLL